MCHLSQIDDNFLGKIVYVAHELDLLAPLVVIRLIDAKSIDPYSKMVVRFPQPAESRLEIDRYRMLMSVDENRSGSFRRTPGI